MPWLKYLFSLYSLLFAIVYTFALLLAYRFHGRRGLDLAASAAFLVIGARLAYAFSATRGPSVPPWVYLSAGVGLLGKLLPPPLLVYRVSRRKPQALPLAIIAGVVGYFLPELIIAGITVVFVIFVAASRL